MEEIVKLWNEYANKYALAQVRVLTPKRKTRLRKCLEIMPELEHWRLALEQLCKSKFHLGENDRKWKATLDWFINTNHPHERFYNDSQIVEPVKPIGAKNLESGVDNETASNAISEMLRGIK